MSVNDEIPDEMMLEVWPEWTMIRRKCERMHQKSVSIVSNESLYSPLSLSIMCQSIRSLTNDIAKLTRVIVDTGFRANSMPSPFASLRVITRFSELIKQDPPRYTRTARCAVA
jgi:hypothetical protein